MTKTEFEKLVLINKIEQGVFLGWLLLMLGLIVIKFFYGVGALILSFFSDSTFWIVFGWMTVGLIGIWVLIQIENRLTRRLWMKKESPENDTSK